MVRVKAGNVRAMMRRIAPGAVLLLDLHYNSLSSIIAERLTNIFAVRVGEQCPFVMQQSSGRVILRPHYTEWPMELVEIVHRRKLRREHHRAGRSRGVCSVTAQT